MITGIVKSPQHKVHAGDVGDGDAHAADRLTAKYINMRANYTGVYLDDSREFDAELVENVILRINRGKAADLDGITVQYLCYSSGMLQYVLSKFFNLCMSAGYVPLSFGMSYTVPILKDKNSVHCKSISVDFRGISISLPISKVFEHCEFLSIIVNIAHHILVALTVFTRLISVSASTHVSACQFSSDTGITLG